MALADRKVNVCTRVLLTHYAALADHVLVVWPDQIDLASLLLPVAYMVIRTRLRREIMLYFTLSSSEKHGDCVVFWYDEV